MGKDSIAPGSSYLQGPSEPSSLVLPDLPGVSQRNGPAWLSPIALESLGTPGLDSLPLRVRGSQDDLLLPCSPKS